MEYEGRICRAPGERASYMLPVSVGCAYNGCKFCGLFKDLTYRELPLEQIEEELQRVSRLGKTPARVYLGDGNAFHIKTERLVTILEMIRKYLPGVNEIRMDSTVPDIAAKSDEELKLLASLNVKRLYLGIESGLEDVLRFMNKCHTKEEATRQIERLHAAGIGYAAHVMTGVAGKGRGEENALALAEFLNETRPQLLVNFSIFTGRLQPDIEKGTFARASEVENLLEDAVLLSHITVPMEVDCSHDLVQNRVWGRLPEDKEKLVRRLRELAAKVEAGEIIALEHL